jgi:hypothetical protein
MCFLGQVISTFRQHMIEKNSKEVGNLHLVLVEGEGKRSTPGKVMLTGRTDGNTRCVFPAIETVVSSCVEGSEVSSEVRMTLEDILKRHVPFVPATSDGASAAAVAIEEDFDSKSATSSGGSVSRGVPQEGDYAVVEITEAKGQVLYGRPIALTTLASFHNIFP